LDQHFYQSSQFAQKASVSVRTLRYYDKMGLLSPSQYSGSGYRLYSNEDLLTLQNILALKFLGFSLEEIRLLLQAGPKRLEEQKPFDMSVYLYTREEQDFLEKALAIYQEQQG